MKAAKRVQAERWTIGRRIAAARKRPGLNISQTELGSRLGLTPQAVSQWEGDKDRPSIDNLMPLAKALKVSVEWLLDDFAHPDPAVGDLVWLAMSVPSQYKSIAMQFLTPLVSQNNGQPLS